MKPTVRRVWGGWRHKWRVTWLDTRGEPVTADFRLWRYAVGTALTIADMIAERTQDNSMTGGIR